MKRNYFNLSPKIQVNGRIGNVQTLKTFKVMAGDSMSLRLSSALRLATLRQPLSYDGVVDTLAFFVAHRKIYPNWMDLVKEGPDSAQSLAKVDIPTGALRHPGFYGSVVLMNQSYPKWVTEGYNLIWNWNIRHPKLTPEINDGWLLSDGLPTGHTTANSPIKNINEQIMFGLPAARLKKTWSTGVVDELTDDDHLVDVTANKFDLLDLDAKYARHLREIDREISGARYKDLMKMYWDTHINEDIDSRPVLLASQRTNLQGFDINGTADQNLGNSTGKAFGKQDFFMPTKFFPEHGTVWIIQIVRFDSIARGETDDIRTEPQPDYTRITGDYEMTAAQPPLDGDLNKWISGPTASIGKMPYGQGWRMEPDYTHELFGEVPGYPILPFGHITNHVEAVYPKSGELDDMFENPAPMGHWNLVGRFSGGVKRLFPAAKENWYAGTKTGKLGSGKRSFYMGGKVQ